jgi:hypothetical protein
VDSIRLPFRIADPRVGRIHRRLRFLGEGPAAYFFDACRLVEAQPRLPTTSHLVAHLMREVESGLRDIAEPTEAESPPDGGGKSAGRAAAKTDAHTAEIGRVLRWLGIDAADPAALAWMDLAGRSNPNALHRRAHRDALNPPRAADATFDDWWDRMLGVLDVVLSRLEDRFGHMFARIDAVVAAGPGAAGGVSALAERVPNTVVAHEHLFRRIDEGGDAASWIEPLRDAGLFRTPPAPEVDPAGESVRYPFWPQGRFLEQVAPLRPELVRDIAVVVETKNVAVQRQLVQVALALPPLEACTFSPRVRAWIPSLVQHHAASLLTRFVVHLLDGLPPAGATGTRGPKGVTERVVEDAFTLATALIDPGASHSGADAAAAPSAPDTPTAPPRGARDRGLALHLAEAVALLAPRLVQADALRGIRLLAAAVARDIEAERAEWAREYEADWRRVVLPGAEEGQERPVAAGELAEADPAHAALPEAPPAPAAPWRFDGSSIKIPILAEAGTVHAHEHRAHHAWELLVLGLRDAVEAAVAAGALSLGAAVAELARGGERPPPFAIFGRLALHALALRPDHARDETARWLLDRSVFDAPELRAEYDALLSVGYAVLPGGDRDRLHGWLAEDRSATRAEGDDRDDRDQSDEGTARDLEERRRRDRLAPLDGQLPAPLQTLLDTLVASRGPAVSEAERRSDGGVWIGPTSPKSEDELRAMNDDALVEYLRTWEPTERYMAPSPDGLGRELGRLVEQDPARYAAVAARLAETHPTYAAWALRGFSGAVGAGRAFPWPGVLALGGRVVAAVDDRDGVSARFAGLDAFDAERGWGGAKRALAQLLEQALDLRTAHPCALPVHASTDVWRLLHALAADDDPPAERADDRTVVSTRPTAVEAVVAFAWWRCGPAGVLAEAYAEGAAPAFPGAGLAAIPEVAVVLEERLDWTRDPSLAVREAFGRRLRQLVALDPDWTARHLDDLLPADADRAEARAVAWSSYLLSGRFYDAAFRLLMPAYDAAVARLASAGASDERETDEASDEWTDGTDARRRRELDALGEHLLVAYWRGLVDLDSPDTLLERHVSAINSEARAAMLTFVGRVASQTDGPLDATVRERFQRLWDWWITRPVAGAPSARELRIFGWWFTSGKFEEGWAVERLRDALRATGRAEPDHLVAAALADLAARAPRAAVECLALVNPDHDPFGARYTWVDVVRTIVVAARASGDPAAAEVARGVIGRWTARGHTELLDLTR